MMHGHTYIKLPRIFSMQLHTVAATTALLCEHRAVWLRLVLLLPAEHSFPWSLWAMHG